MKALVCCLAALLSVAGWSQDLKDTYGKTNAQILAMGYDKWYDYYTGKAGEHTQGMAGAGYQYASALEWRNKGLEAKLPTLKRKGMGQLRKAMEEFGTSVIQVERALNGGGTLWQLTFSSNAIDLEQTLYGVLGGKMKAAPAMVVSKVTKELDALEKQFKSSPADTWQYEFKKDDTGKFMEKAKARLKEIVALAKNLDRKQSDFVLEYCRSAIVDSRMEGRE